MKKAKSVEKRLVSIAEAAEILSCGAYTVRQLVWAKALPIVVLPRGKKMWIDVFDLEAFIQKQKRMA